MKKENKMTKRFDLKACLSELARRYRLRDKTGKGKLPEELCGMTGYHRKDLTMLMSDAVYKV